MANDEILDDHAPGEIPEATKIQVMDALRGLPLAFIPNAGQDHPKVSYYGEGSGYKLFFTPDEVVFAFTETRSAPEFKPGLQESDLTEEYYRAIEGFALYLRFVGANPAIPEGQVESTTKVNYFLGNDPGRWRTWLPTYKEIVYRNLWPNIDLVFREDGGGLKYEFIAYPGADVKSIGLNYSGAEDLALDKDGNILIQTPFGVLTDKKPISYQIVNGKKVPIASTFTFTQRENGEYLCGFNMEENYSPDYTLVIDPSLGFPLQPESKGSINVGTSIAVDSKGNAYVAGFTESIDFPVTPGAFQARFMGFEDAFISVINVNASGAASLVYSTYLGGCGLDRGLGIAVDSSGNAYVTGLTESPDFPVTPGALQTALKGHGNAFITVINTSAAGVASLVYSTYLGGYNFDVGFGIALDTAANAYVTGFTASNDFPVTPGAFQTVSGGHKDAFISVVNTTVSGSAALIYSTYLGGSSCDEGYGIALDNLGITYVTGYTHSMDFPVTTSAFQPTLMSTHGGANAFVTKINTNVSGSNALIYSTYLGGSKYDKGYGIAVDAAYNAYVTGFTRSDDFPVTSGSVQGMLMSISGANAFISKINTNTSGTMSLAYSTYLGGTGYDEGHSIAVDTAGNAYVTGFTYSSDFPVTATAFQPMLRSTDGGSNAFLSKINTNASGASGFVYSTYLGGEASDAGNGLANDRFGVSYVTGRTRSCNFPVTSGAFQPKLRGFMDAFVTAINTNFCDVASFFYSTYLGGSCKYFVDP